MSMVRSISRILGVVALSAILLLGIVQARMLAKANSRRPSAAIEDLGTWIDANKILMIETNNGTFAYDREGVALGNWPGLYYPYTGLHDIMTGRNDRTVIFSASMWTGGQVAAVHDPGDPSQVGDTLVTAWYDNWPGPMAGGTFIPDADIDPVYRVYKLYRDSLAGNPNEDYLNWPADQGAPVDYQGAPVMFGDQTLWTVFNDANASIRTAAASSSSGLGIEVQKTVWANDESGDDTLWVPTTFRVDQSGDSRLSVAVNVVDTALLTGHDYMVVSDTSDAPWAKWHLIDVTTGETKLLDQDDFLNNVSPVVDGFTVQVFDPEVDFTSFQVVANAAGRLAVPTSGAFHSQGFPTPNDEDPGINQQVGVGRWAVHVSEAWWLSCSDQGYGDYYSFRVRSRAIDNLKNIGKFDYEMRFTGSYANAGVNGSYAVEFQEDTILWVPFELWNIGIATPDDSSDDVRLVPLIKDDGDDHLYNLESWGCGDSATYGGDGEHTASDLDDDPYTDWVYWYQPTDMSPGESGYYANEAQMLAGTYDYSLLGDEVVGRIVLVSWNGGDQPPFDQDLPEQGTVFRVTTNKDTPADTFMFTAVTSEPVTTGPEGVCVYLSFKLYNKGPYDLENCFFTIYSDPDVGEEWNDLVGCDTLTDIHFCYNEGDDPDYGSTPPAVGFRFLTGPLVPSPGDTALFEGNPVPDYRNLGMTAFTPRIDGWNPRKAAQAYREMNGLWGWGPPIIDSSTGETTKFYGNGDPVTGTGFLDRNPDDRSMKASTGPFTFNRGDSQFVMVKLAVGQGQDALSSITRLRELLNAPFDFPTDVEDGCRAALPRTFSLAQNYPNPFNASTVISYSLPKRTGVTVSVYNILGQKVMTVVNEVKPAGNHTVYWDGRSKSGTTAASGVYFYRIRAGDFVASKKMVLLK